MRNSLSDASTAMRAALPPNRLLVPCSPAARYSRAFSVRPLHMEVSSCKDLRIELHRARKLPLSKGESELIAVLLARWLAVLPHCAFLGEEFCSTFGDKAPC